jgi:hypothetical protein
LDAIGAPLQYQIVDQDAKQFVKDTDDFDNLMVTFLASTDTTSRATLISIASGSLDKMNKMTDDMNAVPHATQNSQRPVAWPS